MGHADAKTTVRYTHYRSRGDEAARLATALADEHLMGLDAASGVPVAQKHVSMRAFGTTEKAEVCGSSDVARDPDPRLCSVWSDELGRSKLVESFTCKGELAAPTGATWLSERRSVHLRERRRRVDGISSTQN